MIRKFFLILSIVLYCGQVLAQDAVYVSPLNYPLSLAGNFGEVRPNHFHSGVDFKTGGVIGKEVVSVADGYISRIFVSPFGYGKALYITHPEMGTMSVYGHLDRFAPEIEAYVKSEQYRRRSYAVDLYLSPSTFPVSQRQFIAYSGNTGSSGGPHLHFEIREGASQKPVNTIARGIYDVQDDIRPNIVSVSVVEVDTVKGVPIHTLTQRRVAVKGEDGNFVLSNRHPFVIKKPSYFAVEITDRKNNVGNIFAVYKMEVKRSGKDYFGYTLDAFSFGETKYVNTLALYPHTNKTRNDIIRTYISPNNYLSVYDNVVDRGIIKPASIKGEEPIDLAVWDDSGNKSTISFVIAAGEPEETVPETFMTPGRPVWWLSGCRYIDSACSVTIPEKALYESVLLNILYDSTIMKGGYSPAVCFGDSGVPLHKSINIGISDKYLPVTLRDKALLAVVNEKTGRLSSAGGAWKNGYVTANVGAFGKYCIAVDTIPPVIRPLFTDGQSLSGKESISFRITDDFSGIDKWHATIDGAWMLFEYEPKERKITHYFDAGRIEKGKKHDIILTVTDGKGNRKVYEGTFVW